jgi:hypothetical protein
VNLPSTCSKTKKQASLRAFDVLPACNHRVRCMIVGEVHWRPFKQVFSVVTDDGAEFETTLFGHGATPVEVE